MGKTYQIQYEVKGSETKVQKLIDFYDNDLVALNDTPLDGNKLKGEVMADLGGEKVITLLGEKIKGFNFAEMYRAVAKFYGFIYTLEAATEAIKSDSHPLTYLRTNVALAQYDKFQEAFGITKGDGMYIDPSKRITIW